MSPELLQSAAFRVAQSRTLAEAFRAVVDSLASGDGVALARIWLIQAADRCASCSQTKVCQARERCLHLMASAGQSLDPAISPWTRIDGSFQRLPLSGIRKVGHVAASGNPLLLNDISTETRWVARPDWIAREQIESIAAQPLIHHEETLGALALFSRNKLDEEQLGWLRTFADRASAALVNARAFDEIATLKSQLEAERDYLRIEVKHASNFGTIIGTSPAVRELMRQVELVARTEASVLLHGESGTGKELAAVAIHEQGARKDRPLVRVNCASVPRELFESEFFGHARGSFSGAVRDRKGRFELADGGTLFLDELGEIPLDLQSKLLRVLQEGTFERVGDERTRKVDVRIVAATNRNLKAEVAAGRFREDLFYRLSVFPIDLPPLRAREDDVVELATHFIQLAANKLGRAPVPLTRSQGEALKQYSWPGNIRELQNLLERALILSGPNTLALDGLLPHAPAPVTAASVSTAAQPSLSSQLPTTPPSTLAAPTRQLLPQTAQVGVGVSSPDYLTDEAMKRLEHDNLVKVLRRARGRVSGTGGAAQLLGIKASTLSSRLKKLGIHPADHTEPSPTGGTSAVDD